MPPSPYLCYSHNSMDSVITIYESITSVPPFSTTFYQQFEHEKYLIASSNKLSLRSFSQHILINQTQKTHKRGNLRSRLQKREESKIPMFLLMNLQKSMMIQMLQEAIKMMEIITIHQQYHLYPDRTQFLRKKSPEY